MKFGDDSTFTFRLVSNEKDKNYDESAEIEIHFSWLEMAEDNARLVEVLMILNGTNGPVVEIMGHVACEPYSQERAEELKKLAVERLVEVAKELHSVFSWRARIL
jgi:hypothetical protein